MTVWARFSSNELYGKLRDGEYELRDGATVAALMEAAQNETGFMLTDQQKSNCVYIFDNAPATCDTMLRDGGKLRIMFKLLGG